MPPYSLVLVVTARVVFAQKLRLVESMASFPWSVYICESGPAGGSPSARLAVAVDAASLAVGLRASCFRDHAVLVLARCGRYATLYWD